MAAPVPLNLFFGRHPWESPLRQLLRCLSCSQQNSRVFGNDRCDGNIAEVGFKLLQYAKHIDKTGISRFVHSVVAMVLNIAELIG